MSAGDTSYYDEGYYCDYEAPYNPPHAGVVEHRCGEVFAGGYAYRCKEEAYTQLAQE